MLSDGVSHGEEFYGIIFQTRSTLFQSTAGDPNWFMASKKKYLSSIPMT